MPNKTYYQKHKKDILRKRKERYWLNREEICKKWKENHKKNYDRDLKRRRKYYRKNKEHIDEMTKNWRKNNPEKVKEYKRRDAINNKETYRKIHLRFVKRQKIIKRQKRKDLLVKKINIGLCRISKRNMLKKQGPSASNWKGGRIFVDGYIYVYKPKHLFATQEGYVCEHRLVIEEYLIKNDVTNKNIIVVKGKHFLNPLSVVHHIDGNKLNNVIHNLKVFISSGEHTMSEHKPEVDEFGTYKRRI